jgi:streptogramin lyase
MPAGAAGEMMSAGGACPEHGSGQLVIEIAGLPEAVEADVRIAGPDQLEVRSASTLTTATAGSYVVTAARVYDADAIVRTAFEATVTTPDFCLTADGSQAIAVTYAAIPTSNKLWSAVERSLSGFAASALAKTGSSVATLEVQQDAGRSVAFDRDGNVWALGSSMAGPHLISVGRGISITLANVTCEQAISHLAFDPEGNLWLTKFCNDEVLRIAASELGTSGTKAPDASLTSVTAPDALAFDRHGNLWVSGAKNLRRFDAARLQQMDSNPPDLELSIVRSGGSWELRPTGFAFDATGNLWVLDFWERVLFRLAPTDLAGTGVRTVEPAIELVVDVATLSTVPAFDDGGGLWFGLARTAQGGVIGRLSPAQLAMAGGVYVDPEVKITSPGLAWSRSAPVAFFPAPAGLPLFHSLPAR